MSLPSMSPAELVRACGNSNDPRQWEEFIRRFNPLVTIVVLRTCRQWGEYSTQIADDLVQEIYLKLCADGRRLLRGFRPEHPDSFLGYLKVLAANLVHDHFKATHSAKRGAGKAAESLDALGAVSEASRSAHMEREILLHEIAACLTRVAPGNEGARDRRIFWLYYRQGLTAQAIAALPSVGLTTKGVESVILRLIKQLRGELVAQRRESGGDASGKAGAKGLQSAESL